MRKLIPFLVVTLFLVTSIFSINSYLTELDPGYTTDDPNENFSLPTAEPTDSVNDRGVDSHEEQPEVRKTIDLSTGSRFAITTSTIVTLDTPDANSSIAFAEEVEITGHLYEDYDNNGTYDQDVDIPIPDAKIYILLAGGGGDNEATKVTDENGRFSWKKENYNTYSGQSEIQAIYKGQFTINGSEWFDVDQEVGVNEDDDYYIDTGYRWNVSSNSWEYNFFAGNGKFDPGTLNTVTGKREWGDIIIWDKANPFGSWDNNGDEILYDYLGNARNDYTPGGSVNKKYGFRINFNGSLIDEEKKDVLGSGIWADDDGDWNITNDDVGIDKTPGTNDAGEGNSWPDPGEPHVDEDYLFTYYRKASSKLINVSLWHTSEIDAIVRNETGQATDRVVVGETIDIIGKLKNTVTSGRGVGNRAIKLKIFGFFMPDIVRTDSSGNFNYSYTIPTETSMRVGRRAIDIFFDEVKYDLPWDSSKTSYLTKTSLSSQNEIIMLRVYRPTHVIFESEKLDKDLVGYLYRSVMINGTLVDNNNNPLSTTIIHDDGASEILLLDAYELKFEWGLPVNRYYNYFERDLSDTSGNFSISDPPYEITDPYQELGDIPIKITVSINQSQSYYLSAVGTSTVTVRSNTLMELWIDQDKDTWKNEREANKHGDLADYITREKFTDKNGKVWDFNKVFVYGRLSIRERPENGINGKTIAYRWEGDEEWKYSTTQHIDLDYNGKYDAKEKGMFIIPDPDPLKAQQPKYIQPDDPLGPIKLEVKFEDPGGFYDKVEITKEFDVVAMTKIIIDPGSGIKGENVTITGKLEDDRGKGIANQDLDLYWEDMKGELFDDDKFDPVKMHENHLGNVTTDADGRFLYYSEEILTRDKDVGQGFIVAQYDGSVWPYTPTDAFIGSVSDEITYNVSSKTRLKIDPEFIKQNLIRGKRFNLEGVIVETYREDENLDAKVLLTITDASQMEIYVRNLDDDAWTQVTNLEVEFKSEGGYSVTGVVPFNLNIGQAAVRLVFNGTNNGKYLPSEIISYHTVWTETYIKILAPEIVEKDDEEGYFLKDDLYQSSFDVNSNDYLGPLVFRIRLLENNPTEFAEPKPVPFAKVSFNISGKYSVFKNYTTLYTDGSGYINLTFKQPLTDTDWGYKLTPSGPTELEINIEFTGIVIDPIDGQVKESYYEPCETLGIDTTHHPPGDDPEIDFYDLFFWWIVGGVIAAILFVIGFAIFLGWYNKRMRIRRMRRIIKRAADQLVAGDEYKAVIFKSYQKLGVHLRKYGYLRRESETFREFEDAVRSALPIDRISMDKFLNLLEEARYSSHQMGETHRNDAILNLRAIERSLDRILIDEDAALRALERLETEGVKETKIIVAPKGSENVPQLLRKPTPTKTQALPTKGATVGPKPKP